MDEKRDDHELEVRLIVWRDDPIAGRLRLDNGPIKEFVGWVGLMSALEQVRSMRCDRALVD